MFDTTGAVPRKSLDLQQRLDTVFRRNMAFDKASNETERPGFDNWIQLITSDNSD
jgi:hypothetical protein